MFEINKTDLSRAFYRRAVTAVPERAAGGEKIAVVGFFRWGGMALSSLALSACISVDVVKKEEPVEHSPVEDIKDSGPSQPVDVSHVPDAVPKAELRTEAGNTTPYKVLGKTYKVLGDSQGYRQRGIASWYGRKFHGHLTANGERYDMYAMTAAHKSLPIPSYVQVTNLENAISVVVRVNDRGPFHGDRLIDLSYTAASKLGFVDKGTAQVEVVAIEPPKQALTGLFLQAGAFGSETSAQALRNQIAAWTRYPVTIKRSAADVDNLYRVRIGPIADNSDLVKLRTLLQERRLGKAYIVRD